jgi:alpha-beta hydrolase superfamily lysophospholipase
MTPHEHPVQSCRDRHGVAVAYRLWRPVDPWGLVVVAHGASEHGGRYERFAQALAGAGLATVALDQRGHGRTTEASGGPGIVGPGGGSALLEDLALVRAEAEAALGGARPTFLFGHSLGSVIGLAALVAESRTLAGAVLCGFPVDLHGVAALGEALAEQAGQAGRAQPASDLFAPYAEAVPDRRTPYDWLSRDPAEVDRYLADPFCGDQHPLTWGYLLKVFALAAPAAKRLDTIACPVLVIAGDQDPAGAMGDYPRTLAEALVAAGVPCDLRLYPGARHELLNETNRDEVTADILAWLGRWR